MQTTGKTAEAKKKAGVKKEKKEKKVKTKAAAKAAQADQGGVFAALKEEDIKEEEDDDLDSDIDLDEPPESWKILSVKLDAKARCVLRRWHVTLLLPVGVQFHLDDLPVCEQTGAFRAWSIAVGKTHPQTIHRGTCCTWSHSVEDHEVLGADRCSF